jgi:Flp pilus assembly protein TadG
MSTRRRKSRERGATLVEFALIAPLLFAILLGTITGGLALSKKNSITNAVREGARFGATVDVSSTWGSSVQARVAELAAGDLAASELCAEVGEVGSAPSAQYPTGGCTGALALLEPGDAGAAAGTCLVKVWGATTADLNVIFFTQELDLEPKSVGRYEKTEDC